MKDKRTSLLIELYGNYELVIIITDSIKKTRKKLNKELGFKCDIDSSTDGLHSYRYDEMKSFILLTPDSSSGVIAHEALHATIRIMRIIGAKLTKSSEESYAYLLTHIVDTISHIYIDLEVDKK